MASVVYVKLSHIDETGGHDQSGARLQQTYLVKFDGLATALEAQRAVDPSTSLAVPKYLATLTPDPTGSGLKNISKIPTRDKANPNLWRVVVTFGVPTVDWEQRPEGSNIKWSKRLSIKGVKNAENGDRDVEKKPVKNSFGDVYSSQFPQVFYDEEISVSFLSDTHPDATDRALRGYVNSPAATLNITTTEGLTFNETYDEHTLKLESWDIEVELDSDSKPAWRNNIVILRRNQKNDDGAEVGWKKLIVDHGFNYKDAGGKAHSSNVEKFLDGTGKQLADGANAKQIEVTTAFSTDYSVLFAGL